VHSVKKYQFQLQNHVIPNPALLQVRELRFLSTAALKFTGSGEENEIPKFIIFEKF
jgi:hypothetical protein